jgi:hypothetical protein
MSALEFQWASALDCWDLMAQVFKEFAFELHIDWIDEQERQQH